MLQPIFLPVELVAIAGVLTLARLRLPALRVVCGLVWNLFRTLGAHHTTSMCVSAMISLVISVTISSVHRPYPAVHDEFSYLLAADTFAHGRLANPVHPLWEHFETFHVLQSPTYASKYPPGQGLLLAAGIVLGGDPLLGVWLGTALATAAMCWMLQGWVPGRWAFFGAVLFAFSGAIQFEWGQSYWGGAVALIGGALLFGAYPRLLKRARPGDAVLLGLGAALLAASRPFEGLVATLPVATAISWWVFVDRGRSFFSKAARVVAPAVIVLACSGAALAYYHFRVTGDPLKMPAQLHEEIYAPYPVFLWQPAHVVAPYRHAAMQQFYTGWALPWYERQRTLAGIVSTKGSLLFNIWWQFLGVTLTVPLLATPWMIRRPSVRLALASVTSVVVASIMVVWMFPHYYAPIIPALWLLIVEGCRTLSRSRFVGDGRVLVCGLAGLTLLTFGARFARFAAATPANIYVDRQKLMTELEKSSRKHLVLVRNGNDDHGEMVFNGADIDGSKVVWAREMDPARNRRLLEYFADRRAWLLRADVNPHTFRPYKIEETAIPGGVPSKAPTPAGVQKQASP